MENHIKMDDLGVPLFQETSIHHQVAPVFWVQVPHGGIPWAGPPWAGPPNSAPMSGSTASPMTFPQRKQSGSSWVSLPQMPPLKGLPSRGLTYPTLGSSENHRLKMPFLGDMLVSWTILPLVSLNKALVFGLISWGGVAFGGGSPLGFP